MNKEIAIIDGTKQIRITMEDVKKLICENATEKELELFLRIAEGSNLNPFKREIYLIKYGEKANIVIGYEIYLKRAELSDKYQGFERGCEYAKEGDKYPKRAWIKIHIKGWAVPLFHSVKWSEYVQTNQAGIPNKMWSSKPETMLLKVVTCQGLRLAFPNECGGLPYEETEIVNHIEVKPGLKVEEVKENKTEPTLIIPPQKEAEKPNAEVPPIPPLKTDFDVIIKELEELAKEKKINLDDYTQRIMKKNRFGDLSYEELMELKEKVKAIEETPLTKQLTALRTRIHANLTHCGVEDKQYRDYLKTKFGVESSTEIIDAEILKEIVNFFYKPEFNLKLFLENYGGE